MVYGCRYIKIYSLSVYKYFGKLKTNKQIKIDKFDNLLLQNRTNNAHEKIVLYIKHTL